MMDTHKKSVKYQPFWTGLPILFLLFTPHLSWAQAGLVNRCDLIEDDEERSWCYVELAEEEKSLKPCNYLNLWQSISQCIDYVKKVTTLTAKDCSDLKNYRQYCLKQLGFSEDESDVWDEKVKETLRPCVQKLGEYSEPLPGDYNAEDLIAKIKGLRRAIFQKTKDNKEMAAYYNSVMSTCQDNARRVRVRGLLETIEQQGVSLSGY
ncbi:MAG: hypothetical protein AB7S78_01655 [Candidatus Omnitrophota bacterium]